MPLRIVRCWRMWPCWALRLSLSELGNWHWARFHFTGGCGTTEVVPFPNWLIAGEGEVSCRVQRIERSDDFFVDF